jgi:hypothetical protein
VIIQVEKMKQSIFLHAEEPLQHINRSEKVTYLLSSRISCKA